MSTKVLTFAAMTSTSNFALPCTDELLRGFRENGFVLLERALSADFIHNLQRRARELVNESGVAIRRESEGAILSYTVVTGDVIRDQFEHLFAFYCDLVVREWIRSITQRQGIYLSRNVKSAVNINCMQEGGQIYRWHYDAVPYTLILFLTTSVPEDGGALEIVVKRSDVPGAKEPQPEFSILPHAGSLLLMDGTRCLHRAAPLLRNSQRLTVPMVFPAVSDDSRPEGLDDYLYAGEQRRADSA